MTIGITNLFDSLNKILCVCPCCGSLFYLSEANPFLKGKQPQSIIDSLRVTEQRMGRAEERLIETASDLKEEAALAGRRKTKRLLKKIDTMFSGADYDPQDVKVIFNPVTFIIFDGMTRNHLTEIVLLGREPQDRVTEQIHKSIQHVIEKGNLEFRTLQVDNSGRVSSV